MKLCIINYYNKIDIIINHNFLTLKKILSKRIVCQRRYYVKEK